MVIYKITNLINGRQYIGRDSKNNPNYYGSGPAIKNAIKKYGKENFKKEIIEHCSSLETLIEREEYWLNHYDAANNKKFYNIHNYGKGGTSDISGERNPMFGKKHTAETKRKLSELKIGKKASLETKIKMSEMRRGSNNPRYKMGHLYTGEKNGNFKGYIICTNGQFMGERKTNKEWCEVLGIIRQNFRKHLLGIGYKNGIKGNFFQWEKKE